MMLRPLAGIRAVEVGSDLATVFGARLLADLGAEVIKVEPAPADIPAATDEAGTGDSGDRGDHAFFGYLNHGKRSVTLDHHSDAGSGLLSELACRCDVLLWAADPHTGCHPLPAKLGQPGDADRPVTVAVSPYGVFGPRSGQAGSPYVAQHSGGFAYHQAAPVRDPETTPPVACADWEGAMAAGVVVATAALWGLAVPRGTGPRPFIDVSHEDIFAFLLVDPLADLRSGALATSRRRDPARGTTIAGGLVWLLPCADGPIVVSPREDHQWQRWLEVMGNPDWGRDRQLCGSRAARAAQADRLRKKMTAWSSTQKSRDVFRKAQAARVACFPVSTPRELLTHQQLIERGFFSRLATPAGPLPIPGLPFAMRSSSDKALRRGHTVEVTGLGEANGEILVGN